ncbi:MAG: serine hydrolase [Hyphomicrobiales bacterium]
MTLYRTYITALAALGLVTLGFNQIALADHSSGETKNYFKTDAGVDLRKQAPKALRPMLVRTKGQGKKFGTSQLKHYCKLKSGRYEIQYAVNDLETNKIIARSKNAEQLYFGASSSKLFVAAALLDKQEGKFSRKQLGQLIKMIVVSDNPAWISLQKQTGSDGSSNSGRRAVQAFTKRAGYKTTQGFQGWMVTADGKRVHGNELNSLELAKFLHDTYKRNYRGADVVWKIMQATRTGKSKAKRYTPRDVYIGGKTGTYSGPNEARATVKLKTIKSRNHVVSLMTPRGHFGISILSNTGSNEDVAVLAGGLMREYLGIGKKIKCGG